MHDPVTDTTPSQTPGGAPYPRGAVEHALRRTGHTAPLVSCALLTRSGEQEVWRAETERGPARVVKSVPAERIDRLAAEADGLKALARSGHLLVPEVFDPVTVGPRACLVMQAFDPPAPGAEDPDTWASFGRALGEHHRHDPETSYGWERDNYIGATPQPNTRCDDWVRFNAEHRLGHQLALAEDAGLLGEREIDTLRAVIDRLDRLIPRRPRPALLHGDLWSGNALLTRSGGRTRVALIDPAVSVGDAWADIAMMRLFGGFPEHCLRAYGEVMDDHEGVETRVAVYQLYHMLNHLNLFGGGYRGSVMAIAERLTRT